MPYSDADNAPDQVRGWSPERSHRLGGAVVRAFGGLEW
jgi:hypothetical protein